MERRRSRRTPFSLRCRTICNNDGDTLRGAAFPRRRLPLRPERNDDQDINPAAEEVSAIALRLAPSLIRLEFSIEGSCESIFTSGCVGVVPDRVRNPWCYGGGTGALILRIRDGAAVPVSTPDARLLTRSPPARRTPHAARRSPRRDAGPQTRVGPGEIGNKISGDEKGQFDLNEDIAGGGRPGAVFSR